MTAPRKVALTEIAIIAACRDHAQKETALMPYSEERQEHLEYAERDFIAGAEYARSFYEQREAKWRAAFEEARDYILNERGPLAEQNAGSDFINDVLGILDDSFATLQLEG